MMEKKEFYRRIARSADQEDRSKEKYQPAWIRKYLDLADLLMRRRRQKTEDTRPKAA